MTDFQWKESDRTTNPETLLSTALQSLTNGSGALSGVISNDATGERDVYMDLVFDGTIAVAPTEDSLLEVHIVREVVPGEFEDTSTEGRPRLGFVGGFVFDDVTSAQRLILPKILLPPTDFKVFCINQTGQTFPASAITVKGLFYLHEAI